MRKHQKLAVLKDDEVDRLERASTATTGLPHTLLVSLQKHWHLMRYFSLDDRSAGDYTPDQPGMAERDTVRTCSVEVSHLIKMCSLSAPLQQRL